MITPRHANLVRTAIQKQGLLNQDFELTATQKELGIRYLNAGLYFIVIQRDKVPDVSIEAVTTTAKEVVKLSYRFSIEHVPNLVPTSPDQSLPVNQVTSDWDGVMNFMGRWLAWIKKEYGPFDTNDGPEQSSVEKNKPSALTHLHPAVQSAAGSRFASAHYSDAIQKSCTALEKAVQVKSGQPVTATGTSVMTTAFSQNNPLIRLADDPTERFGFMNLYQGAVQALRNHFAHNLTELTDPARALEWLGFISALFYKLDETIPVSSNFSQTT